MSAPSDRDLVDAARTGDLTAQGELVRRHQKRMVRLAQSLLHDPFEAEDVTQEAFVRAFRALGSFDGRSQFSTWLYRITLNACYNANRARKARPSAGKAESDRLEAAVEDRPGRSDPSASVADRALHEALHEAMSGLSETLRTTLVLVTLDGLGHQEAADILGCPTGTVAWRVHEARRKLRAALAARGYSEGDDG